MNLVPIVSRGVAAVLGLACLYIAAFLYEDEEKRLQSRLEDLWLKLEERKVAALSRHAALLSALSATVEGWLARVFGDRLLSLQGFGVSVSYSLASIFFGLAWGIVFLTPDPPDSRGLLLAGVFLLLALLFAWVGTLPLLRPRTGRVTVGLAFLVLALAAGWLGWGSFLAPGRGEDPWIARVLSLGLSAVPVAGVVSVTFFVALSRRLVNWGVVEDVTSPWRAHVQLFAGILLNFSLLAVFLGLPLSYLVLNVDESLLWFLYLCANLPTSFASLLLLGAGALLLLHRLAWPLLNRSLYALQRYNVFAHRKKFWGLGLLLLGLAVSPTSVKGLLPWVKALLKAG